MSRGGFRGMVPRAENSPAPRKRLPDGSISQDHGGSFRNYMTHKINKLQEQYAAVAAGQQQSELFRGVSIHVNGLTTPSHAELKQLMALHGGAFCNYFESSKVTHIICSNLPDTKVREFQKARQPCPVVRPEWVVDSIRAGELLPILPYVLYQLRDAPGQAKLKAFAQVRPAALPPTAIYGETAGRIGGAVEGQAAQGGDQAAGSSGAMPAAGGAAEQPAAAGQPGELPVAHAQQPPTVAGPVPEPPPAQGAEPTAPAAAAAGPAAPHPPSPPRPASPRAAATMRAAVAAGAAAGYDPDEQAEAHQLAARLRAECEGLRGPPRTSREDPNFVATFFNNSRLHFIGSWKARIEALMASADGSQGPAPKPPSATHPRTVVHLDMDCFFASVAEVAHPVLRGKPVAVSHSASASGTGEVSTCNYEARKFGVRSGMFIAQAKSLCPYLVVVPYMFEQYQEASEKVYRILLHYTSCVQALSCDEAFLDVTGLGDPQQIASTIRSEIHAATGCTASAGIGPNLLVARIAGERAKPNGQMQVQAGQEAREFLQALPVDALPGVGWSTGKLLEGKGLATVADLQARSKGFLQELLGPKQGAMLWDFAQGKDNRPVEPVRARKSVGAEVNYALRFRDMPEAFKVLDDLAAQVHERLMAAGVKGRSITLKLKRRKPGAQEPRKFLGHGECDNFSKSVTLARFTDAAADIGRESRALLLGLQCPAPEIRGLGIQVTKLDNDSTAGAAKAPPAALAAFLQRGVQQVAERQQQEQQQQERPQQHQVAQQPLPLRQQMARPPAQPQGRPEQAVAVQNAARPQQPSQDQALVGASQEQAVSLIMPVGPGAAPLPAGGSQAPLWEDSGSAKGPAKSPPKQPSLEHLLVRAAAHGGASQEEAAAQRERQRRLMERYQGVSLSQMDASALEALPYEVQMELVAAMQERPAGGQEHLLPQTLRQQHQQQEEQQQPQHRQQPQEERHRQQTGQETAAARAAAEAAPAAAAAGASKKARGKRPLERGPSEGDEGWEEDDSSQPVPLAPRQPAGVADGAGPSRAAEGSSEEAAAGSRQPAGGRPGGAATGRGAASDGRASRGGEPPIVALPALSEVDRSVLDALPLQLRRELEVAYGIGQHSARPPPRRGGRSGGASGRGHHAPGAAGGGLGVHVSKRQRLDFFVANPPPFGVTARGQAAAARQQAQQAQQAQQRLSLSQVDPTVLRELPPEVQQEVMQQLQQQQQQQASSAAGAAAGGGRLHGRPQQRSRLGEPRDQEQAWQQQWQEERQRLEAAEAAAAAAQADFGLTPADGGQEEDGGEASQRIDCGAAEGEEGGGCPPLPPALQAFLAQSGSIPRSAGSGWVRGWAAALGECLAELEEAGAGAASLPSSSQQQEQLDGERQQTPSPQPRGSAGARSSDSPGSSRGGSGSRPDGEAAAGMEVDLQATQEAGATGEGGREGGGQHQQQAQEQQRQQELSLAVPAAAADGGRQGERHSPQRDCQQRPAGPEVGLLGAGSRSERPDAEQSPTVEGDGTGAAAASASWHHDRSSQQQALQALSRSIQQAASALLAARDLEQLRLLLRSVRRFGSQHPWFAAGAGQAAVEAAQQRVQVRYGWQLSLAGLLEEGERGGERKACGGQLVSL